MAVGTSPGELRELTEEELTTRLRESKEELFNLRFQMATGQLGQQPSASHRTRRNRHAVYNRAARNVNWVWHPGPVGEGFVMADSSTEKKTAEKGPAHTPRTEKPRGPSQDPHRLRGERQDAEDHRGRARGAHQAPRSTARSFAPPPR